MTSQASYFVLAGLAVFERDIHWFNQDLDALQKEFFPSETEPVFFHATKLRVREGEEVEPPWDQISQQQRRELKDRIYRVIANRHGIVFGCAIERKLSQIRNEDPYERAFEDLVSRFDLYLSRINRQASAEGREEQRGMVVLAESSYQKTITILGRRFRDKGTRWGLLHNVSDVPLFAPARDMRMLQYADFCSNAIYGRYHAGMTKDFDIIAPRFDQEGPVFHGLAHWSFNSSCTCPACLSRRSRQPPLPTP